MKKSLELDWNEIDNADYIVGIDEVGNGCIAGPLAVGVAILQAGHGSTLRDSKSYSKNALLKAHNYVVETADFIEVFYRQPDEILEFGHSACLQQMYHKAITWAYDWLIAQSMLDPCESMFPKVMCVLDGKNIIKDTNIPHIVMPKADALVPAVSAAAIAAKVTRDKYMANIEAIHPFWGFDKHVGYPTKQHTEMLSKSGPIKGIHRMNIERCKNAYQEKGWCFEY